MKRIILSLAFVVGIAFMAQAGRIHVQKVNGGKSGHYLVDEVHKQGNASLVCKDPGNEPCTFTVPPSNSGIYHQAKATVHQRINEGQTSGSMVIGGYLVKWPGTDIHNYTMNIAPLDPTD